MRKCVWMPLLHCLNWWHEDNSVRKFACKGNEENNFVKEESFRVFRTVIYMIKLALLSWDFAEKKRNWEDWVRGKTQIQKKAGKQEREKTLLTNLPCHGHWSNWIFPQALTPRRHGIPWTAELALSLLRTDHHCPCSQFLTVSEGFFALMRGLGSFLVKRLVGLWRRGGKMTCTNLLQSSFKFCFRLQIKVEATYGGRNSWNMKLNWGWQLSEVFHGISEPENSPSLKGEGKNLIWIGVSEWVMWLELLLCKWDWNVFLAFNLASSFVVAVVQDKKRGLSINEIELVCSNEKLNSIKVSYWPVKPFLRDFILSFLLEYWGFKGYLIVISKRFILAGHNVKRHPSTTSCWLDF